MGNAKHQSITKPTAFLNAVARVHLSHLFQDPFLKAAFKAAEDDGLAPDAAKRYLPSGTSLPPATACASWRRSEP